MTMKHTILGVLAALSVGSVAAAQPYGPGPSPVPLPQAASTQTGGSITTHLTFQSVAASNTARKGCLLVNTSSDTELVYFGTTGSATSSNTIPVVAGGNISCWTGNIVLTDNIAVTSLTTDGATYVLVIQ